MGSKKRGRAAKAAVKKAANKTRPVFTLKNKQTSKKAAKPIKKAPIKKPAKSSKKATKIIKKTSKAATRKQKAVLKPAKIVVDKKLTEDVAPEFNFWLSDGRVIKNVAGLAAAAKNMGEDVYAYHATQSKNDFADWIRDIISDLNLAYAVRKAKSKKEFVLTLEKALHGRLKAETPEDSFNSLDKKEGLHEKKAEIEPIENSKKQEIKQQAQKSKVAKQEEKQIEIQKIMPSPLKDIPFIKEEEEKKTALVAVHKEIQKLPIKKLELPEKIKKNEQKKKENSHYDSFRKREEELIWKERELTEEEHKLNETKIELTKRRYSLLKERGTVEKEKFEHFLMMKKDQGITDKILEVPQIRKSDFGKLEFSQEEIDHVNVPTFQMADKEDIEKMVSESKKLTEEGNVEAATRKYIEADKALNRSMLSPEDKRALRYLILELETDLRLAKLKPIGHYD